MQGEEEGVAVATATDDNATDEKIRQVNMAVT